MKKAKSKNIAILGIDPSYTGTGISLYRFSDKKVLDSTVIKTKKDQSLKSDIDYITRINIIIQGIEKFLDVNKNYDIFVIGLESPSIGSRGLVLQLGGLYYSILRYLEAKFPGVYLVTIPPTTMKIIVAGHGHAEKEDITKSIKALRVDIGTFTNENQIDATGLAITAFYAAELASGKTLKLSDKQIYSLRKII